MREDQNLNLTQRLAQAAAETGAMLNSRCQPGPCKSELFVLTYSSLTGAGDLFATSDFAIWATTVSMAISMFRQARMRRQPQSALSIDQRWMGAA